MYRLPFVYLFVNFHWSPLQKSKTAGLAGIVNKTPKSMFGKIFLDITESFVYIFLTGNINCDYVKSSRLIAQSLQSDGSIAPPIETTGKNSEPT